MLAFQTSESQPPLNSQTSLLALLSSGRTGNGAPVAQLQFLHLSIASYAAVRRRSSNRAPRSSDFFWVIVYSDFGPPEWLWLRPDATFESLKVTRLHPSTSCACVQSISLTPQPASKLRQFGRGSTAASEPVAVSAKCENSGSRRPLGYTARSGKSVFVSGVVTVDVWKDTLSSAGAARASCLGRPANQHGPDSAQPRHGPGFCAPGPPVN